MERVKVVRAEPVEPPISEVHVRLSPDEARFLVTLLGLTTSAVDRLLVGEGFSSYHLYNDLIDAGVPHVDRPYRLELVEE